MRPTKSDRLVPAALIALSLVPAVAGTARAAQLAGGGEITPGNARFFVGAGAPAVPHVVVAEWIIRDRWRVSAGDPHIAPLTARAVSNGHSPTRGAPSPAPDEPAERQVMQLDVYINYRGTCEEAFRFYERHLGGKITGMVRHADQPSPNVPPDWKDRILHARIEIAGTVLMGADIPQSEPMRSAYLSLTVDGEDDAERLYALLTDGGEIFMKMEQTPFANRFAMLRDRFGTSWMLLHQPEAT